MLLAVITPSVIGIVSPHQSAAEFHVVPGKSRYNLHTPYSR